MGSACTCATSAMSGRSFRRQVAMAPVPKFMFLDGERALLPSFNQCVSGGNACPSPVAKATCVFIGNRTSFTMQILVPGGNARPLVHSLVFLQANGRMLLATYRCFLRNYTFLNRRRTHAVLEEMHALFNWDGNVTQNTCPEQSVLRGNACPSLSTI